MADETKLRASLGRAWRGSWDFDVTLCFLLAPDVVWISAQMDEGALGPDAALNI